MIPGWEDTFKVCECGKVGALQPALVQAVNELCRRMGQGVTVVRAFQCLDCQRRFEGYGDSGHSGGTDVDILVYGQYYRHKMLGLVGDLFPVISINGTIWHLSVRKDWPQNMCTLAF